MAWLSDWAKRVKLTIDQNDIDATLANFPILVHLGTSVGRNGDDVSCVFDELESDANRKKIAVTTSDGQTQCYVEIEKWDDASEQAWLWVKVPSVASGADTDLYLYYDKEHANNDAYVGDPSDDVVHNVWDANFKLVSHMRDDPDTSHIRDSTNNNNDGTKTGAGLPAVTADGKIDGAQDFAGGGDNIGIPGGGSASVAGDITITLWIKSEYHNAEGYLFADWSGGQRNILLTRAATEKLRAVSGNGGSGQSSDLYSSTLENGAWYLVDYVRSGNTLYIYKNGQSDSSIDITGNTGGSTANQINMGSQWNLNYIGIIDEVRVSNIARTPAWIKASYESERDHLLGFGSEEEPVTPKTSSDTGAGVEASSQVATLTRSETGSGQDARLDFLAVLSKADSGEGAEVSNLIVEAMAILSSESGIGVEAIISRQLSAIESGSAEERASRAGWLMKPAVYTKDAFEQKVYTGE
ncbi:hypothetical protein ES708_19453 [subsurface metagenome]